VSLLTLGAAGGMRAVWVSHDGQEVARHYPKAVMDTRTTNRPDPTESREQTPHRPTDASPRIDLSLTQVLGGSLAAATAAALGSRLGVVGTITGAALVSVVASVAGAIYTTSLRHTRDRMSAAIGVVTHGAVDASRLRSQVRLVAVGAAAVFVLAVAGVTATELVTGSSLDGRSGSTTVASTFEKSTGTDNQTPSPSPTVTPSPTGSATTSPSATQTPSETPTPTPLEATPSPTPTQEASPTVSPSGTPDPSASGSPSASSSPTAVPTSPTPGVTVTP
jgi:hypothetical protein